MSVIQNIAKKFAVFKGAQRAAQHQILSHPVQSVKQVAHATANIYHKATAPLTHFFAGHPRITQIVGRALHPSSLVRAAAAPLMATGAASQGGGMMMKAGRGVASVYNKITANPFAGAEGFMDFAKVYGTGAFGILATETAVRGVYEVGAGHPVHFLPTKEMLLSSAFGGLNRFAALPAFALGYLAKTGKTVTSAIKEVVGEHLPEKLPTIPDFQTPQAPTFNFPAQNFAFEIPQAPAIGGFGGGASFSPSLQVGGGGIPPEMLILLFGALAAGGAGGYLLGRRKKRKRYKRRKHR